MEECEYKGDVIIGCWTERCCRCGASGMFISLSFEGAFCTLECLDRMWDEYFQACRVEYDNIDEPTITTD